MWTGVSEYAETVRDPIQDPQAYAKAVRLKIG